MTTLPASIEAYLLESGFTSTEIFVLKRLLEGQALTLRELASKTGKSTGVLDQAMRKLTEKGIISKENINESTKFTLSSLEAIQCWIAKDTEEKHATILRKKENFDAFLATITKQKNRPDMEFFDGVDGIQKSFEKLLAMESREWLQFIPALVPEGEDLLNMHRIDLFRDRRRRKIFLRVIAPDTPLGRRYKSRDVFEYRKTLLIPEKDFPVSFEKFIVEDTVACLNTSDLKGSFIRYPALADEQRNFFEMMWTNAGAAPMGSVPAASKIDPEVAVETQVLSGLREFFMSRKSLVTLAVLGVIAAGMTWGMYVNNARLNVERVREKVLAVATTGSQIFNEADLQLLHSSEDVARPEYKKVVRLLDTIRKENKEITYVYIIRPTGQGNFYEFVADSYGLHETYDANGDGIIDDADEIPLPGMPYDASEILAIVENGLQAPVAVKKPISDQWGTFISGFAPIRDVNGNIIAVLGVDKWADDVTELTLESFSPVLVFLGIFLVFVAVRLVAFHQSLAKKILQLSKTKQALSSLAVCSFIALLVTFGIYQYTLKLMKEEIGQRLMSISATAVAQIDAKDLEPLRFVRDMERPEYQRVFETLNEIRNNNENIRWAYIFRKTELTGIFEFVADADTNYNLPDYIDFNNDGLLTEDEENVAPGVRYFLTHSQILDGFEQPIAEKEFYYDQWGVLMSGYAPIRDETGDVVAILGLDMDIQDFYHSLNNRFELYFWFFASFGAILLARLLVLSKSI